MIDLHYCMNSRCPHCSQITISLTCDVHVLTGTVRKTLYVTIIVNRDKFFGESNFFERGSQPLVPFSINRSKRLKITFLGFFFDQRLSGDGKLTGDNSAIPAYKII